MNYENVANFVTKLHVYLENRIFVCKSKIEAIIEHDWAQGNLYVFGSLGLKFWGKCRIIGGNLLLKCMTNMMALSFIASIEIGRVLLG